MMAKKQSHWDIPTLALRWMHLPKHERDVVNDEEALGTEGFVSDVEVEQITSKLIDGKLR